jgi:MFS family permease
MHISLRQKHKKLPVNKSGGSIFMGNRTFRSIDYFMIAIYWFAISFLWGGFLGIVLPVLNKPLATPIFGADNIEIARGIMSGLGLVIAMFVQPLAGAISDRSAHPLGRRRPFMVVGTLGVFVALTIIVLAGNWWFLLIGYILLQFMDNIAQGSYQGLMPDVVPEEKRGRASAALAVSQMVGTLVGAVIPGILQGLFGEVTGSQLDLLLVGIVFVISLALTMSFVKEKQYHPTEKMSAWQAGISMFRGVRHYPDFIWLMFSRLVFLTAPASVSLFVKSFMEGTANRTSPEFGLHFIKPTVDVSTGQLTPQAGFMLSLMLGLVVIMAAAAAYPFSLLSERIGRKTTIYLAMLVGLIGGLALLIPHFIIANAADTARTLNGFEAQQNYMDGVRPLAIGLMVVFGSLIGASWGAFMAVDWAFATDLIPLREAGRFMGLSNLATAGCQAFAAFVGGFIVDSPLGFTGLLITLGIYYGLSAGLLTRVREQRGKAKKATTIL